MYDYPQLFSLSSSAVRGIVTAVVCVALLAGASARVLRLKHGATAWLFAFTASGALAGLLAVWDISPALTFWVGIERWVVATVVVTMLWLLIILAIAATQDQVTLIESVVATAIIVGFFWYLSPSSGETRAGARQNQCSNNLWQIGIAIHMDAETAGGQLIGSILRSGDGPPRSWRVDLLPFLDQERLRKRYNDRETWDALANSPVARWSQHPFACPNSLTPMDERKRSYTAYLACTGPSAFFPPPATGNGRGRRFADIRDGISNTVMVVEACGQNVVWTEPRDLDIDKVSLGVNLPGFRRGESAGLLSSHDPGSAGMVMGDGSVRRLSVDVDPSILKGMLTIDGREPASFD